MEAKPVFRCTRLVWIEGSVSRFLFHQRARESHKAILLDSRVPRTGPKADQQSLGPNPFFRNSSGTFQDYNIRLSNALS